MESKTMTIEHELNYRARPAVVRTRNPTLRKYLEFVQDVIVLGLCAALFIAMLIKLFHLGDSLLRGTDFSEVISDILFILVLIELFRCWSFIWRSTAYRLRRRNRRTATVKGEAFVMEWRDTPECPTNLSLLLEKLCG